MRHPRPTFVVTFEPLPHVDAIRALRALLKSALRRFGLRALDYREEFAACAATSNLIVGADRDARTRAPHRRNDVKQDEDMRKYAGSTFLKVEDFADDEVRDTEIIDVQDGRYDRPLATFIDGSKSSLSVTNCKTLCRDLGPLRKDWLRHPLQLYKGETKFEGKEKQSILIRVINPVPVSKRTPPPPLKDDMGGEEIPF